MPVYEYQCEACKREFEYQQRMADPEKTVCEACGGKLDRLISRTAFSLKGGGWYKDLYSSSKPEAAQKAEGGDKPSGGDAPATPAAAAPSSGGDGGGGGAASAPAAAASAPAAAPSSGSSSGGGTT